MLFSSIQLSSPHSSCHPETVCGYVCPEVVLDIEWRKGFVEFYLMGAALGLCIGQRVHNAPHLTNIYLNRDVTTTTALAKSSEHTQTHWTSTGNEVKSSNNDLRNKIRMRAWWYSGLEGVERRTVFQGWVVAISYGRGNRGLQISSQMLSPQEGT